MNMKIVSAACYFVSPVILMVCIDFLATQLEGMPLQDLQTEKTPSADTGWSQFRGSNSDGHASGPNSPANWSGTENVVWKTSIAGLGWSSPAVGDGKIFLTTATEKEKGLSLRALALNESTGEIVWDREINRVAKMPSIHKKNSHASPTALFHEGSVFVHFGTLGTARLSTVDGKVLWKCLDLNYSPQHGSGGSPVLHDGKLMVTCDGRDNPFVAALDIRTGNVIWKTKRSEKARIRFAFATPKVATVEGNTQLLAPGADLLAAYDPGTGKEIWKVVAPGWSVVPQPVVGHGLVIYNHDYDHPELIAVRLGGQGDVTESHIAWRIKRGAPSTPSPILVGENLYFVSDNGIASCVNVKSGERIWMERLKGNYSASPVYANGNVLFLNELGLATWVSSGKEFEILGKNELPGRTFATPAFSGGAMYIRTDQFIYKIAN